MSEIPKTTSKKSTSKKKISSPVDTNTAPTTPDSPASAPKIEVVGMEPSTPLDQATPKPKRKYTKRAIKENTEPSKVSDISPTTSTPSILLEGISSESSDAAEIPKKATRKPRKASVKLPAEDRPNPTVSTSPSTEPSTMVTASSPSIQKEIKPQVVAPVDKTETQVISTKETEASLLERIPSLPGYLINRMSKDAQKIFVMGLLEMNRLPADKLEKAVEHLTGSRMFFDGQYENEKEIITFLDRKMAIMNKRLESLREAEAQDKIHKMFTEPLEKGKFDKFVKQLGGGYSIENCVYDIMEKMGRDVRKIPLSEYALRQKFEEILRAKYKAKLPK